MPDSDATRLLQRLSAGDEAARGPLLTLLYEELRGLADGYMRRERGDHTLQATALIHEAWLKLERQSGGVEWSSRGHFMGLAARAMRQVLIDHARVRNAEKRAASAEREPLDDALAFYADRGLDLLSLDEALERLAEFDPQGARIVDLRFFGGLKNREVAEVLELSERSVERSWSSTRAWLQGELGDSLGHAG